MLTVKFCSICNFLATCEAKWSVSFVNKTNLEAPEVKVRIDGYYVTIKYGQEAFWGPYGDVEKVKTPRGTHAVVTNLNTIQTCLDITLYPGDEPPLPETMVVSAERAFLLKRDAGCDFKQDLLGVLPQGTKVRPLKRGAPVTELLSFYEGQTDFPPWVTLTEDPLGSYVSAPFIKVEIPKEVCKKWGLPKRAWIIGNQLSEEK